ncbi:MAG: glycosyl hydrolase family 2 [Bacteroidales bacterium]|nr:glycosyl hydrolase family 2 [Bacteroidales bacterium]
MNRIVFFLIIIAFLVDCTDNAGNKKTGPAKVTLEQTGGKYRLFVNGAEFYVKGAGCEFGNIEALAEHGANSFRTWRTENGESSAGEILDRAYSAGLMVLMGLEVGRERHGFDYDDTVWVRKQYEYIKDEVIKIKDHPALLGWAIGNEINLGAVNMKVFDAVNEISEMIHKIDTCHVTTTTLAGIGKREADYIRENCTDIDFLSIQMYADIINLQKRIEESGWEGPYMVAEWGATGHWEVARTKWDAPIEPTSTEKAASFLDRYTKAIEADSTHCLGSFVFLWGQKQERTPTWYGMFLESGEITETVDAMHKIWTGKWPENRCPTIDSFLLNGLTAYDNIILNKGATIHAEVSARDHERDTLNYKWEIMHESKDLGWGGDHESKPETWMERIGKNPVEIEAPSTIGAYRLFLYVLDGKGHAATANIPFCIAQDE